MIQVNLPLYILLCVLIAGCASTTGLERAERTSTTMEGVEGDIERTLDDIDGIETSLYELIRPGQRDASAAFERYTSHVESLEENGRSLIANSQEMQSSAEEYFAEWERENNNYENQSLREISEQRRTEVQENYESIYNSRTVVEDNLERYITDNNEIQSFLSNDLTTSGIESITPVVEEAIEEGELLRQELTDMQEAVESTREGMSTRGRN